MPALPKVILKPEKEKPVLAHHPWIFSGAIKSIDGKFEKGELATIHSHDGKFLAKGYVNPESQITARVLTFQDEPIDQSFFKRRIQDAFALRENWLSRDTDSYRMVHSEGDFLPGLIVDKYADYLVVQFLTAGMDKLQAPIVEALRDFVKPKGIFEKDETEMRQYEGLPERQAILFGQPPPDRVTILEHGLKFLVDIHGGQKTGFFLDQRENRFRMMPHASNKRVLNCFGYTGAFSVYAAKGGANEVVTVEASQVALRIAEENLRLSGFDAPNYKFIVDDVFDYLRRDEKHFDMIILDPPAFAPTKASVMQASRGYKDINRLALKLLAPGGLLFTYSCSHHIDAVLFQQILFAAAKDSGVNARILEKSSNPFDHPVNVYHPEGEYLKGFVLRKT